MRASLTVHLVAQLLLGASILEAGELPDREPLDVLWEQSMLEGKPNTTIAIQIEDGQTSKSELPVKKVDLEYGRGAPESAGYMSPGITVVQYGEGFWENGGWILKGGLLGIAKEGSSTIELHGKAIVHRFPYFPFPFHRTKPHETGYEFFLLHREAGSQNATILRKWILTPQEVVLKPQSVGPPEEDVRARLNYEGPTKLATVTITGSIRPFKESVTIAERAGTKSEQLKRDKE